MKSKSHPTLYTLTCKVPGTGTQNCVPGTRTGYPAYRYTGIYRTRTVFRSVVTRCPGTGHATAPSSSLSRAALGWPCPAVLPRCQSGGRSSSNLKLTSDYWEASNFTAGNGKVERIGHPQKTIRYRRMVVQATRFSSTAAGIVK